MPIGISTVAPRVDGTVELSSGWPRAAQRFAICAAQAIRPIGGCKLRSSNEGCLCLEAHPGSCWFSSSPLIAGGIAAVTGFGIGSLLTPVLALQTGNSTSRPSRCCFAPACHRHCPAFRAPVKVAHHRRVIIYFGLTSAAGGLQRRPSAGVGKQSMAQCGVSCLASPSFAASELMGFGVACAFAVVCPWECRRLVWLAGRFGRKPRWPPSLQPCSGFIFPSEFCPYGDGSRLCSLTEHLMLVYLVTQVRQMVDMWLGIVLATIGVTTGTRLGSRVLAQIPKKGQKRVLAVVLALLGAATFVQRSGIVMAED